jgi:hypothetical protein
LGDLGKRMPKKLKEKRKKRLHNTFIESQEINFDAILNYQLSKKFKLNHRKMYI